MHHPTVMVVRNGPCVPVSLGAKRYLTNATQIIKTMILERTCGKVSDQSVSPNFRGVRSKPLNSFFQCFCLKLTSRLVWRVVQHHSSSVKVRQAVTVAGLRGTKAERCSSVYFNLSSDGWRSPSKPTGKLPSDLHRKCISTLRSTVVWTCLIITENKSILLGCK